MRVWYVGLDTPALHIARVRARVARGGHDIPEARVRGRFDTSRLEPDPPASAADRPRLYDNCAEADPAAGVAPSPMLVLHLRHGRIVAPRDLRTTPDWAKPVVAAATRLARRTQ